MSVKSCLNCVYLFKKPGIKASFVFKCNYWGLVTENILPQSVVISSIGKRCPFYKEKKQTVKSNKKENKLSDDNNLDITV